MPGLRCSSSRSRLVSESPPIRAVFAGGASNQCVRRAKYGLGSTTTMGRFGFVGWRVDGRYALGKRSRLQQRRGQMTKYNGYVREVGKRIAAESCSCGASRGSGPGWELIDVRGICRDCSNLWPTIEWSRTPTSWLLQLYEEKRSTIRDLEQDRNAPGVSSSWASVYAESVRELRAETQQILAIVRARAAVP